MDPSEELIRWAADLGVPHALDRPWFFFPISIDHPKEEKCPCPSRPLAHGSVVARRYSYVRDSTWVWLGQCPECRAIVWSFAPQGGVK